MMLLQDGSTLTTLDDWIIRKILSHITSSWAEIHSALKLCKKVQFGEVTLFSLKALGQGIYFQKMLLEVIV